MKTRIRYLLRQYVENRASRQELEEFFHIVNSAKHDEELAACVKETYEALKQENPSLTYIDSEGELNFLPDTGSVHQLSSRSGRKVIRLWIPAVAVAVLLVFVLLPRSQRDGEGNAPDQPTELVYVIKQAANDENKVIQLSDGTKIWLNSSSKLEYPQAFDASSPREVTLIGEAFFEVEKAADWPFIVHTGSVKTTVLGTAFNIKAYPGMDSVSVSVKHGKVAISKNNHSLATLENNQELRVALAEHTSEAVQQRTLSSKVAGSWKEGYLDYEDETIASIVADLQRFYGITVRLQDALLADELITISLRRDSRPEYALNILCRLTDKQLKQQGDTFIIY